MLSYHKNIIYLQLRTSREGLSAARIGSSSSSSSSMWVVLALFFFVFFFCVYAASIHGVSLLPPCACTVKDSSLSNPVVLKYILMMWKHVWQSVAGCFTVIETVLLRLLFLVRLLLLLLLLFFAFGFRERKGLPLVVLPHCYWAWRLGVSPGWRV